MGKQFKGQASLFFKSLYNLIKNPQFLILTIIGNLIVFVFSFLIYLVEVDANPLINEPIDAVWWAFSTVTTVGYGDITPSTFGGKIIGIALMLIGTALFATYISLFAEIIIGTTFRPKTKKKKDKILLELREEPQD